MKPTKRVGFIFKTFLTLSSQLFNLFSVSEDIRTPYDHKNWLCQCVKDLPLGSLSPVIY